MSQLELSIVRKSTALSRQLTRLFPSHKSISGPVIIGTHDAKSCMQRHCHSVDFIQRTIYAGAVSQADTSSGCRCCEHSLIDIVHTHTRAVIDSGTEKYGVQCAEINIVSRDLVGPSHLLVGGGDELQTPILYALGLHAVYHPRRDMPHVASRYARTHAEYTEARNQARSAGGRTRDVVQRSKCYKNLRAYFFILLSTCFFLRWPARRVLCPFWQHATLVNFCIV